MAAPAPYSTDESAGRGESAGVADSILRVLDEELAMRSDRQREKEHALSVLKESASKARDTRSRFEAASNIFDEYRSYHFDSALVYADRMLSLARALDDPEAIARSKANLIYCYLSVGFYKEAEDVAGGVEIGDISPETAVEYFSNLAHLHQNLSYFVARTPRLAESYREAFRENNQKIIDYAQKLKDPVEREKVIALRSLYNLSREESYPLRKRLVAKYQMDNHELAIQSYILHEEAQSLGLADSAIYYLAQSAVNDIRGNVRETLALATLAERLLERGDVDAARRYVDVASDDAKFYGTDLRQININSLISKIENQRYLESERQRYVSLSIMAVIIVSLFLTLALYLGLRRRNRLLRLMRAETEKKSEEIDRANRELQLLNDQLREVNEIKERYIVQSLCADQTFINSVEEKSRTIDRKLKAKQFDDLAALVRQMGVKQERRRIQAAFDQAFLALFPNFIDEFNKLFPPEFKMQLTDEGFLPTELKIYGLMRLGVEDTATVAHYLNISVNTIYVYKARVKAATIVPKEEFERYIKAIPKP